MSNVHTGQSLTHEQSICNLRDQLSGSGCGCDDVGMTLTIHTGLGAENILVFENVQVDSVKVRDGVLIWEDAAETGRSRCFSILVDRVIYWETE